jgi:hypothetical protein
LAAKVSLASRIDALCDESLGNQMGIEARALLEGVAKSETERGPKRYSSGNKPQYGNQRKGNQFQFKRYILINVFITYLTLVRFSLTMQAKMPMFVVRSANTMKVLLMSSQRRPKATLRRSSFIIYTCCCWLQGSLLLL